MWRRVCQDPRRRCGGAAAAASLRGAAAAASLGRSLLSEINRTVRTDEASRVASRKRVGLELSRGAYGTFSSEASGRSLILALLLAAAAGGLAYASAPGLGETITALAVNFHPHDEDLTEWLTEIGPRPRGNRKWLGRDHAAGCDVTNDPPLADTEIYVVGYTSKSTPYASRRLDVYPGARVHMRRSWSRGGSK